MSLEISLGERTGATVLQGHGWQARILPGPPLIAPARQFVFPQAVPGEEDALARGTLYIEVRPASDRSFLAQCALGFASGHVAQGLWPSPRKEECLAVAGGYAYLLQPDNPKFTELLPMRPVVQVLATPNYLLLAGHHDLLVRSADGRIQRSPQLTWEGFTLTGLDGARLSGTGWDMLTDEEIPFTLDLETGALKGGGYRVKSESAEG